jgi:hypothetical protein
LFIVNLLATGCKFIYFENVLQKERELYEYIINEGKVIHKQSGEPLDTSKGPKDAYWIFVMSTARRLYAGKVDCLLLQGLPCAHC